MGLEAKVAAIIEPALEGMGIELVRVSLSGNQRMKLQIMAEPADGSAMTVDHCADVSRAVSALLDVEDPINKAYTLEVSSPGVDRPLTRPGDYERFAGLAARVEMDVTIGGRRRFKGRIAGLEDGDIVMDLADDASRVRLPFSGVKRAKLLLTDELIAAFAGEAVLETEE